MRKLLLLCSFLLIGPLVLVLSLVFLLSLSYQKNTSSHTYASYTHAKSVNFAALPSTENIFTDSVTQEDSRVEMIRQFLVRYSSPLEPYAQNIVDAADRYGLDFRLLPAIAMQESNLCKKIPNNSYNCWGFGIYGHTVTRFNGYAEAIDVVTKTLAIKYKAKGLTTPTEIMSLYTPSSNGSWAHGVNTFMSELQ